MSSVFPSRYFLAILITVLVGWQTTLGNLLIAPLPAVASNYFLDVPTDHPNYQAISTLRRLNLIRGFVDSTFQPDKDLTRAELLKLAIASKGVRLDSPANVPTPFNDVSRTDWFAPYVAFALDTELISRGADRRFNPHRSVTRVEAIKIFLNLYEVELPAEITVEPYLDLPIDHWATAYVWAVKFRQLFPISGESFDSEKPVTRGEVSELAYRLLAITTNEASVFTPNLTVDFSALVLADQSETASPRDQILDRAFVQLDELTKRAIAKVQESVVSVIIFQTDKRDIQAGGGSGIIISADGYIITNKHVVSRGAEAAMVFYKNELFDFKIVAVDPLFDLAVIKIDKTGLTPATLGDSDLVGIGDTVLSMGYSLSLYRDTVGRGVISGRSRTVTASGGGTVETLTGLLQTDTPISPGNSGGPLFNLWGEVVGINTAIDTRGNNLAFAIPINDLKGVAAEAVKSGQIVRPFLGVRFITLNPLIARSGNYGSQQGALLPEGQLGESAVISDSPAAKAGLQTKDVILKVDNTTLDDENNTLLNVIQRYRPGSTINLTVLRNGQLLTLPLEIGSKTAPIPTYQPAPTPIIIRLD